MKRYQRVWLALLIYAAVILTSKIMEESMDWTLLLSFIIFCFVGILFIYEEN